ncbi:zinc-ribbon domain-containing protein [Chakrabartyella piscis]|uniref:zinc-ribbon domain-containing protein n=1 Tax=Chakrabartyella piscis TaxID=2918914 RepID=UPI002958AB6F|nr:zinc-ribbon domain-containing protein [Chakrabartyella piscis]
MTLKEHCIENKNLILLDEWSNENGDLTPSMVLSTSNMKIWWECTDCGEQYQESVAKRLSGTKCPNCSTQNSSPPLNDKLPKTDLTGQVFGRLTVLSYAGVNKETLWRCRCECGKEIVIVQNSLTSGKTRSCGCLRDDTRVENFKKNIHFVDGTCIEKIMAKVTPSNNTSGFRGVNKRANGTFRVTMTFRGKRYELGNYKTMEEAIEARLAGEVMLDEFVEDFKKARCSSI